MPAPDTKQFTLSLGQLVGFIFGPGVTLAGVVIWLVVQLTTLKEHDETRAAEAKTQAETLGKIQETLTLVRIQLAASLSKNQSPPTATTPTP